MPSVKRTGPSGRTWWRSLDEVADTEEFRDFMYREFPSGAERLLDGPDRRGFLKVMGASMALAGAGLAGCRRWPREIIAPYAARPEGLVPGVAEQYASIVELGGVATGVLVTSHDGRPTKLEGNPEHPGSLGALTAWQQATVLDLYDPDRSRSVHERPGNAAEAATRTWEDFDAWWATHAESLGDGAGLAFLADATSSPSMQRMQRAMRRAFPKATWTTWDSMGDQGQAAGLEAALGGPLRPVCDVAKADVIVSLDCDFLGHHPDELAMAKGWSKRRDPRGHMNRVYAIESTLTTTGASADDRWALRPGQIEAIAAHLAAAVTGTPSLASPHGQNADGLDLPIFESIVNDLMSHKGTSLVVAGRSQPAGVHAACALINDALGNVGTTVSYARVAEPEMTTRSLADLVSAMNAGQIDTLCIMGTNPVHDAPADLDFASALARVTNTIHHGTHDDETARACHWHLTGAHQLESWGDGRGWDATVSVQQPLIHPLWGGRSGIELLAHMAGEETVDGFDIVRRTWQELVGTPMTPAGENPGFDPAWRTSLHSGVVKGADAPLEQPTLRRTDAVASMNANVTPLKSGFDVVFTEGTIVGGRFCNNGWLQELPDPITKLTWDNAVLMAPSDADAMGVANGDVVRMTSGTRSIEGPVLVQPGQAAGTVTVALGYGRTRPGRVGLDAGFDAFPIRTSDHVWTVPGCAITPTGGSEVLITTQSHNAIDSVGGQGEQARLPVLFREAALDSFKEHPNFARDRSHTISSLSLFEETQFEGAEYRWGMAIDLSKCTGCSACVTACQAENNIPIVGKEQVRMGREMHWLRIDRYYRFAEDGGHWDVEQPASVAMQPMLCQQCENAPCEQVCPVAATTHTTDGLNAMIYNRCVGTRYCSNNCPYKVRRYNYFDYFRRDPLREAGMLQVQPDYYVKRQSGGDPLRRMQFNPEVTVRMRGVMEKCTWCTQRIEAAKIDAGNTWVKLTADQKKAAGRAIVPDGTIVPACAQTCATDAIIFGDLMDETSQVAQLHKDHRSYELLGELNVKPRNKYIARVINPSGGERFPGDFGGHGGHGHDDHGHDDGHAHEHGEGGHG